MEAVSVRGLHKRYRGWRGRGTDALRGVDLSVAPGCVFGLIGANGAGKTTLIKILLDVVRPSAGSVRLLGGAPEDPAVRRQVAYLPERLRLPQAWTALAWLASVARMKGLSTGRSDLQAALERVGLRPHAGGRIGTFSKGMRQRLGLAACLLGRPALLVLDEPTDGLDPLARAAVRRIFGEERARGATLFINSHLLTEAERVCDRIGIIHKGRLVREGPLAELRAVAPSWRCRFGDGGPQADLQSAGLLPEGDNGWWLVRAADAEELDATLQRARDAGARLVELVPGVQDLEQVLATTVAAEETP